MAQTRGLSAILLFLCVLSAAGSVSAQKPNTNEYVDTPTSDIFDYGSYDVNVRLHGEGGLTTRLVFGVLKPINLGIGFDTDGLIGNGPPHVRPPAVIFKGRIYGGNMKFPSIAAGYDGQGYGRWDTARKRHKDREKGFYLVLSKEMFFKGWEWNLGGNWIVPDGGCAAFLGMSYIINDRVMFVTEWDNIQPPPGDSRFNLGVRVFLGHDISIDLGIRKLFYGSEHERIIRIDYHGIF